jgi:chaperonin cofactor prefoldin
MEDGDNMNRTAGTTTPLLALENQLVYKIASLEATISNSLRRLDEKFDRLQTELHDRHIDTSNQIATLASSVESRLTLKRARMDAFEREIQVVKEDARKDCEQTAEKLETKIEVCNKEYDKRLTDLEKWQAIIITRGATIGAGILIVWAVFGQYVQDFFGRILN